MNIPTGDSRSPADTGSWPTGHGDAVGRPEPAPAGPGTGPATTDAGGAYRTAAVVLALIVTAALAYGLVQTALKASALFTG